MDRERRLAAAQIIQPDQTERENAIGMHGIRADTDGGPGRSTLPQQRSWIGGREAVFQVGFGGELG